MNKLKLMTQEIEAMYYPTGLGVAIVTPMDEKTNVDEKALRTLVRDQIEGGVDFLVPCGTTGESVTLTEDEQHRVISVVLEEAAGRVPVVAGAGSNNTAHAVHMATAVEKLGVQGILSISPYYNKPTQEGIYQHFRHQAEAVGIGVVVYNCPGRTSSNILPETLMRLTELPNIVAVKEASGNIDQMAEIIRLRKGNFKVLSGDDAFTLPLMVLGGDGVISVVGNQAPKEFADLVHSAMAGDYATARALHHKLLPLMRANFIESNPIPVKTGLAMMGKMQAALRLPLVPMTESGKKHLRQVMAELNLLPEA